MKRLLLASTLLAFASVASAQSVTIVDEDPQQAMDTDKTEMAEGPDGEFADRLCLRQTGSRIVEARNLRTRDANRKCIDGNGRVYTRADINQTGEVDLADALRKLDPSIR